MLKDYKIPKKQPKMENNPILKTPETELNEHDFTFNDLNTVSKNRSR